LRAVSPAALGPFQPRGQRGERTRRGCEGASSRDQGIRFHGALLPLRFVLARTFELRKKSPTLLRFCRFPRAIAGPHRQREQPRPASPATSTRSR
jgi:hypothetical protein